MKSMYFTFLFFLLLTVVSTTSCKSKQHVHVNEDTCYGFDVRQCGADKFALFVDSNASSKNKASQMKKYFESHDISVLELSVQENFYEFVCSACETCPETYRYIVKFNEDNNRRELHQDVSLAEKLAPLNLFHLEKIECNLFSSE